jgi:hypothetical protein
VYPGFWSCDIVGTNHPVHEVHKFATVQASSLQYQVLETSAHLGETIHAVLPPVLQSKKPPARFGLEPNGADLSKVIELTSFLLNVTVAEEGKIVCAIPTNWFRVLIVFLRFYGGTKYK